jgi:uncharacterized protein
VRGVVDVDVLISATLSARGPSAEVIRSCRDGAFELVVSELLIAELTRALAYPKIRKRIPVEQAAAFISVVRDHGPIAEDPGDPPSVRSPDPDDDYLMQWPSARARISLPATSISSDSRRTSRSSRPPSS